MNFLTAVHTDIGIKKKTNQDSALIMEAESDYGKVLLSVICDGMGGLAKGEVASSAVIKAFVDWFENDLSSVLTCENIENRIFGDWEKIALLCNDKIAQYGSRNNVSMGTTLVALLIYNNRYYVINIGDSRVYSITDGLYQLTKDQSFVQREMDMGRMTLEEARTSPQRNVLLQCIGASNTITPDFLSGPVSSGQIFMMCTDGFRHVITEAEIYERFNSEILVSEQAMLDNAVYLTDLNKYRREQDNITVALVKAE